MISHFYFKASATPFDFDLTKHKAKHVVRRANMVFLSINDDVVIQELDGVTEFRIGFRSLSHATIRWFEKDLKIEVEIDRFGLQSVFYHQSGDTVFLSNRINTLGMILSEPEAEARDMMFYLVSGFLPAGRTFWKHIHRVAAHSTWNLREGTSNHLANETWESGTEKSNATPAEIIQSLRDGLDVIHDEVNPTQLRLSGGADTRVVSALWEHPIEAVSARSPWVAAGEDQDVNLAQAWSKTLGWPHRVLEPDLGKFAFFADPTARPMLTGLCGGEFLGGQFNRVIPSGPSKWDQNLREYLGENMRELVAADTWYQTVSSDHDSWLRECARVYLQSARSTIYGSLVESWTIPCEIHFNTVSPFIAPPFLEKFMANLGNWGDYEFYEDVFRALGPKPSSLPLSSQLTLRAQDLKAGSEWGVEPKSVKPKSSPRVFSPNEIEWMISVLAQNGAPLSFEAVSRLFTNSPFRVNAISLFNWMDVRFPR